MWKALELLLIFSLNIFYLSYISVSFHATEDCSGFCNGIDDQIC